VPSLTPKQAAALTPKQAAATSGFSLDTLRYYERIGLLPRIRRTAAGRRAQIFHDLERSGH
jgi:DNA-binding transcriptional MerR regulator